MRFGSDPSGVQRTGVVLGLVLVLILLANVPGIETNQMLLGAILVLGFGLWYLVGRGTEGAVPRTALLALGLYLGWLALAGVPSLQRSASLGAWFVAAGSALALLAGAGTVRARMAALRTVVMVGAALTAVAALAQGVVLGRLRISGFIGNAEPLGAFLALALPFAVVEVLVRRGRRRWFALLGAGAVTLALLASFSYTAWVGLLLGASAVLARRGVNPARALRIGGLALLGALVLLVVVRFATTRSVGESVQVWRTIDPTSARQSFEQRIGFQEAALRMVADRPWFGSGPGTFQTAFPPYAVSIQEQPRYAHNRYLELAAEAGLPALALLTVFLYAALRTPALRLRREADPTVVALAASVATGLVAAAFDFGLQFPVVAVLWWFLLGALVAVYRTQPDAPAPRVPPAVRALVAAVAVLVLVRGTTLAAAGALNQQADRASRNGDLAEARRSWERSAMLDPRSGTFESVGWNLLADRREPTALDRAWTVTEREGKWDSGGYFRYHLRGRIGLAQDDLSRAVPELRRALERDPWFHLNFHHDYAVALRDSGRSAEARDVLTRVLGAYERIEFSSSPTYAVGLAYTATLLGDLYRAEGWDPAAVRAYRHALVYEPAFAPAREQLQALGADATPAVLY